jgi:hypothetical protein
LPIEEEAGQAQELGAEMLALGDAALERVESLAEEIKLWSKGNYSPPSA